MQLSENFYGELTFYVTAVVSFLVYIFLIRLVLLRRKHQAMNVVTTTSGIIILAMGLINSIISFSYARYLFPEVITVQEQSLFALAYQVYFILWILSNNYFLNRIARIPPHRRTQFRIFNIVMNIEIVITAALAVILSNLIPNSRQTVGLDTTGSVEIVFVVISQIALLTFFYFNRALKNEQTNNASKLIKARLQLLRYAIQVQMLLSIVIGIFAGLLSLGTFPGLLLEFSLFGTVAILSLVTSIIIYSSINIPNRVRVRFNIAPKRFNYVIRARTPTQ